MSNAGFQTPMPSAAILVLFKWVTSLCDLSLSRIENSFRYLVANAENFFGEKKFWEKNFRKKFSKVLKKSHFTMATVRRIRQTI